MKKKNIIKILVTVFIILLLLILIGFFFIYPTYNKVSLIYKDFDPYRAAKDVYIALLTKIAPPKESFSDSILGAKSIEETLSGDITIDEKNLEKLHTILEISSANIKGNVSQGTDSNAMNLGFWHFPTSKYPGEKGNVVIIGHRFQYVPPAQNTFYNLDKIKIGDEIKISNDDGEFTYIVIDTKEVLPNDVSVLQSTKDYTLTLITCTPLWTSEKRLVITAKLDKLYKKV